MRAVQWLTGATILGVAKKILKLGASILTDGLQANKVPYKQGYKHDFTVVSQDPESLPYFVWVHKFTSNAKAFIFCNYHGLGQRHLQAYLDAFCYRTKCSRPK